MYVLQNHVENFELSEIFRRFHSSSLTNASNTFPVKLTGLYSVPVNESSSDSCGA